MSRYFMAGPNASLLPEGVVTRIEAEAGGRTQADAEATAIA
jgi:hypothetical protein